MAFVSSIALPVSAAHRAASSSPTRPTMSAADAPVSRRAALRIAAFSIAGVATAAFAQNFDLKELKEDVEELNYEEEVVDVGPDAAEKNPTRTKKKAAEPKYKAEEKEVIEESDDKFDAMVAKELEDEARIKQQFGKK